LKWQKVIAPTLHLSFYKNYIIICLLATCVYRNITHLFHKLTMARTNEIAPEIKVSP